MRLVTFLAFVFAITASKPAKCQSVELFFSQDSLTVPIGSVAEIDIRVNGFQNIFTMQFPITFDRSRLELFEVLNYAPLCGFGALNHSQIARANQNGKLTFSWFSTMPTCPTRGDLPDGSVVATLRFKVHSDQVAAVRVANVAPGIEFTTTNFALITARYDKANLFINGNKTQAGPLGPNGIRNIVRATPLHLTQGGTGCMDVVTDTFPRMVSMQYALHWDPTVVQLEGIVPGALQQAGAMHRNVDNDRGFMLSIWSDSSLVGLSLLPGTVLYKACFKAVGAPGSQSLVEIRDAKDKVSYFVSELADCFGNFYEKNAFGNDTVFVEKQAQIVAISDLNEARPSFSVWPNPTTTDNLHLRFDLPEAETLRFYLTDATGRQVFAQVSDYPAGQHQLMFPGDDALRTGVYWLSMQSRTGIVSRKVVVR